MRFKNSNCSYKKWYASQSEAFTAKQQMRKLGQTLQVYKCKHCSRYHIGKKLKNRHHINTYEYQEYYDKYDTESKSIKIRGK